MADKKSNKQFTITLNESKKIKPNRFKPNKFVLRSKVLKQTLDKMF